MAIDSTVRRVVYAGNGSRKTFPFTFKIFNASDIAVFVGAKEGTTATQLKYGDEYTVDMANGIVTTTVAPPVGDNLAITSAVPETQPMELTAHGGFNPETLNDSADRAVILIQQLVEKLSRTIEVPITSNETPEGLLKTILIGKAEAEKLLQSQDAIDTLALHVPAIETVSDNIDGVQTVADNIGSVNTVARNIGSVNAVAPGVPAIIKLADNWNQVVPVVDVANQVARDAKTAKESADEAEWIRTQYLEWSKYLTIQNGMVCVTFSE